MHVDGVCIVQFCWEGSHHKLDDEVKVKNYHLSI